MHGLFSFWKDTPRIYLHEPERDFLLYLWALHLHREQTEEVSVSLINDLGLTQLELRGLCWKSVWPSKPSPVSVSYQLSPHTCGERGIPISFPPGYRLHHWDTATASTAGLPGKLAQGMPAGWVFQEVFTFIFAFTFAFEFTLTFTTGRCFSLSASASLWRQIGSAGIKPSVLMLPPRLGARSSLQ